MATMAGRSPSVSSPSRSTSSASPPPPPPPPPPPRKASPVPVESAVLHIDRLSRNVNEAHLKEIFENYGQVVNVELSMDRVVNLPRGYGYVEFNNRADAEKALLYMDGGQIDGNVVRVRFAPVPRQRDAALVKALPPPPKRDVPQKVKLGHSAAAEKAVHQRPRQSSPERKPLSSPRRRSPPSRRVDSTMRRLDSPPNRRRPEPYPVRRRSPSPLPQRLRSPRRLSPKGGRGRPVHRGYPLPQRRLTPPRQIRSPPRRLPPLRHRSRSTIRRPIRSPSRSISPLRHREPPVKRGRSTSSSSYSETPTPPRRGPVRDVPRSRDPIRPFRGGSISSHSRSTSSGSSSSRSSS